MVKKPSRKPASAPRPIRFVLDCSIVIAWFFADESDKYVDDVANSLAEKEAVAPSLWPLEVANALVVGERRGRCTPAQSTSFLARLANLPIALDDHTQLNAWSGALPLARVHQLSAYDAAYLELAIREGLPFASLDSRMQAAAKLLGIKTYKP